MELLIDGYNLLHATDLFGSGVAAGTLQGSREALLNFLASTLTPSERRRTTIVFDATDAPPGLPASLSREGITVHFARDFPDADSMLESLIEARPRGKGLTVVSSDRRVQRAARSRGAKWLDADAWYGDMRRRQGSVAPATTDKVDPQVGDAGYWTDQFSDEATLETLDEEKRRLAAQRPQPAPDSDKPKRTGRRNATPKQAFGEGIFEGFPPGYAEDLADELEDPPSDPTSH